MPAADEFVRGRHNIVEVAHALRERVLVPEPGSVVRTAAEVGGKDGEAVLEEDRGRVGAAGGRPYATPVGPPWSSVRT
jgi:hypothetical protein